MTQLTSSIPSSQAAQARRGLLVFGLLLLPLSALGYWFYIAANDLAPLNFASLPLMWAPGLASIVTRLVLREGFGDVSFRWGSRSWRAIALGLAVPLVVGTLAYGLAFLTRLAQFAPPAMPFLPPAAGPVLALVITVALAATLGTLILLPSTAGEEIGWRGYLLPRLIQTGLPRPLLLTGLLWGAWHLVPLFAGGYAAGPSPILSAVILMVAAVAFSYLLAWLRLDTGSIWPAVAAHAAWNAIINGGFDLAAEGESARYWIGESGVLVTVALLGVVWLIGRTRRKEVPQ